MYVSFAKIAANFKYPKLQLLYCGWFDQSAFSCAVNYVWQFLIACWWGQKIDNARTKVLFVAADKSKLKKHDKNLDILNRLVGMVRGWYACVFKLFRNFCNYNMQTCMKFACKLLFLHVNKLTIFLKFPESF